MAFHSDNETGIAKEILDAVYEVNDGTVMPYGNDDLSGSISKKLSRFFGTDVEAYLVVTGTASNCLALSTMSRPFGGIYCHDGAHILVDECGGPEFFTGGARLLPVSGAEGKLHVEDLREILETQRDDVHYIRPDAVSLTQVTESGTVYSAEEVIALSKLAHDHGLHVHMDGTRFSNAVATLGCHPADISWKAGVDVLCFGASKNGAIAAEAIVFFNKDLAKNFISRRKRAGHLPSKMRFISAQFSAYLENQRWLTFASHANAMTSKLELTLKELSDVEFAFPVEANLIFANIPNRILIALQEAGYQPDYWDNKNGTAQVRFVTAFNTTDDDVDKLVAVIKNA